MLLKIFLSVLIIILFAFLVIVIKAYLEYKENPYAQYNVFATSRGIPSISHENASKKVSESICGAEKMLSKAKVLSEFSAESFLNTLE